MAERAADADWLGRRRRYRRLAFGAIAVGAVGFVIADVLARDDGR